jgi:hypothetical protein
MVVLFTLLSEATALYVKLGRSAARERSAREAREVAMDAVAAAWLTSSGSLWQRLPTTRLRL